MRHCDDKTILVREANDLTNRRTEPPCDHEPGLEAQSDGGVPEGLAMLGFAGGGLLVAARRVRRRHAVLRCTPAGFERRFEPGPHGSIPETIVVGATIAEHGHREAR